MAHQAHNIPWSLLASNLEWKTPTPWNYFATNLYPRMKPNQANDLTYFVNAFVKNLEQHSACERKKYPTHYDAPEPSDVILDDATVKKISPTIFRWRLDSRCLSDTCAIRRTPVPKHSISRSPSVCKCEALPREERLMSAFLRDPFDDPEYHMRMNKDAHFNIKVVQTLMIYGEIDPILRICAHPGVHLKFWLNADFFEGPWGLGWKQICKHLLSVYICLNVAYCFPELWDPASGRTEENDYRNTKFYQRTLSRSGTARDCDLRKFPHSQFFGTHFCESRVHTSIKQGEHWLHNEKLNAMRRKGIKPSSSRAGCYYRSSGDNLPGVYGRVSIREFLAVQLPDLPSYDPSVSETDDVRTILCSIGLPVELALDIMEFANYKPSKTKLNPPHDPLHPANRKALGEHLKYCWQTMVRCCTIASELGMDLVEPELTHEGMNWKCLVADTIIELFGHHKDKREHDWSDWEFPAEKLPKVWYNKYTISDDDAPVGWRGPFTEFV